MQKRLQAMVVPLLPVNPASIVYMCTPERIEHVREVLAAEYDLLKEFASMAHEASVGAIRGAGVRLLAWKTFLAASIVRGLRGSTLPSTLPATATRVIGNLAAADADAKALECAEAGRSLDAAEEQGGVPAALDSDGEEEQPEAMPKSSSERI